MALATNLAVYWTADSVATDATGNGNTLTAINSATYAAGKITNAFSLARASSQRFEIAHASQIGLDFAGDISMSMWLNFTSIASGGGVNTNGFLSKLNSNGSTGTGFECWLNNNGLLFTVGTSIGTDDMSVSWTPSTGTWYHVVIVMTRSTKKVDFYVNGAQQGTQQSITNTIGTDTTSKLFIGVHCRDGANVPGSNRYFDGLIDEVGVWGRTLSAAEVTSLYNGGSGLAYPFPSFTPKSNPGLFQAVKRASYF
jgi:hypothetical protein